MSMFAVPGAYDRAITVFSPDGRLFQVEYASETVKRGATVLGIACPDGVVLAAEERATSKLQDPTFMWKIFQIDEHVGAAVAGLSCDAHILVDQARVYAQSNRLLYDEPIDVEILTRHIGEIKQLYTQHAGVRPWDFTICARRTANCHVFGWAKKRPLKLRKTYTKRLENVPLICSHP